MRVTEIGFYFWDIKSHPAAIAIHRPLVLCPKSRSLSQSLSSSHTSGLHLLRSDFSITPYYHPNTFTSSCAYSILRIYSTMSIAAFPSTTIPISRQDFVYPYPPHMQTPMPHRKLVTDILNEAAFLTVPKKIEEKQDYHLWLLSAILTQMVNHGDKLPTSHREFRSPNGRKPPISIKSYVARLLQYAPCNRECFLMALVYMDRIIIRRGFLVNSMNVHRLFLVSVMMASKFCDDQPCDNVYFATVGGVSIEELNEIELSFLALTEFHINVPLPEFEAFQAVVEGKINAMKKLIAAWQRGQQLSHTMQHEGMVGDQAVMVSAGPAMSS
eukprot:TRINITY_DN1173_c0_g1_i1.p2 TRINITY_DN1173_c0_g1~~TRINITY_DN1173_c0_g1_i1.p2  ORF type:complete len:327 (-),score=89.47 TRINITY_DN1173_c0_g1_i1:258-1238(-)